MIEWGSNLARVGIQEETRQEMMRSSRQRHGREELSRGRFKRWGSFIPLSTKCLLALRCSGGGDTALQGPSFPGVQDLGPPTRMVIGMK